MSFDDSPIREYPRPCDRCGAGNVEYMDDNKFQSVLCAEVQLAFGLIAWLCHDCRKQWHKDFKILPLNREYTIKQLEIEFWRARVGESTPVEELEHGKGLVNEIEDMELKINEIANEWLLS